MEGVEARGVSRDNLIFVERRCRDAFRTQPDRRHSRLAG
jgi:hypothetical protein